MQRCKRTAKFYRSNTSTPSTGCIRQIASSFQFRSNQTPPEIWQGAANIASISIVGSKLSLTSQHDRNPVTTKHEKRPHAHHLFALRYVSFLERRFHSLTLRDGLTRSLLSGLVANSTPFLQRPRGTRAVAPERNGTTRTWTFFGRTSLTREPRTLRDCAPNCAPYWLLLCHAERYEPFRCRKPRHGKVQPVAGDSRK